MPEPTASPLDDPREIRLHAINLACSIRKAYIDFRKDEESPADLATGILRDARAFEAYIQHGGATDVRS